MVDQFQWKREEHFIEMLRNVVVTGGGYADAELLLKELRSFAPEGLPEKDEEARLLKELEQAKLEHDIERNERPELPIQGPREQQIRRRLEEIQSAQSGGIALLPFYELLVPGSIQLKSASWSSAPSPPNAAPGGEIFPKMAWTFDIEMTLR